MRRNRASTPMESPIAVLKMDANCGSFPVGIMRVGIPAPVVVNPFWVFPGQPDIKIELRGREKPLDLTVSAHSQIIDAFRGPVPIAIFPSSLFLDLFPVFMDNLMIFFRAFRRQSQGRFHPDALVATRTVPMETDPELAISCQYAADGQYTG